MSKVLIEQAAFHFQGSYDKRPLEAMRPVLEALDALAIAARFDNIEVGTRKRDNRHFVLMSTTVAHHAVFSIEMVFKVDVGEALTFTGQITLNKSVAPTVYADLDPNEEADVAGWVNAVAAAIGLGQYIPPPVMQETALTPEDAMRALKELPPKDVRHFQRTRGLPVDGIVGPATFAKWWYEKTQGMGFPVDQLPPEPYKPPEPKSDPYSHTARNDKGGIWADDVYQRRKP